MDSHQEENRRCHLWVPVDVAGGPHSVGLEDVPYSRYWEEQADAAVGRHREGQADAAVGRRQEVLEGVEAMVVTTHPAAYQSLLDLSSSQDYWPHSHTD